MTGTLSQGPIPSPEVLEGYDRVVPGAAATIIAEFQAQSSHRRSMERTVVWMDGIRAQIGQLIGGGVAAYMVFVGAQLLEHGKSLDGFASIGTAIGIGAIPFATRAIMQHQERQAQNAAIVDSQRR